MTPEEFLGLPSRDQFFVFPLFEYDDVLKRPEVKNRGSHTWQKTEDCCSNTYHCSVCGLRAWIRYKKDFPVLVTYRDQDCMHSPNF
jgi:hypothetical protein